MWLLECTYVQHVIGALQVHCMLLLLMMMMMKKSAVYDDSDWTHKTDRVHWYWCVGRERATMWLGGGSRTAAQSAQSTSRRRRRRRRRRHRGNGSRLANRGHRILRSGATGTYYDGRGRLTARGGRPEFHHRSQRTAAADRTETASGPKRLSSASVVTPSYVSGPCR